MRTDSGLRVERRQVLAYRLAAQALTVSLPRDALLTAAGLVGAQTSRVDSALLSVAARVEDLHHEDWSTALLKERTLFTTWGMRGAPFVVPTADRAVFTAGAEPADEASFALFLGGWAAPIAAAGTSSTHLLDEMVAAALDALDAGPLPVDDLRHAIYEGTPRLQAVRRPPFARADMPEPLFRALGLRGIVCIVDGEGTTAIIDRTDRWLHVSPPEIDLPGARAELLRRYLRCYAPIREQDFAEWTARSVQDVRQVFHALADELVTVDFAGVPTVALAANQAELESPPEPNGIRMLPALDPFLAQRDRSTLVPRKELHRRVWRHVGPPGVVLAGGEVVATWRAQKQGRLLAMTVAPFTTLGSAQRDEIAHRTQQLAQLRQLERTSITIDPPGEPNSRG